MQVCSGIGGIIPLSSARTPGAMAQTAPGGHKANSMSQRFPNGTYSRRVLQANVPWNCLDMDNARRHSLLGGQLLSDSRRASRAVAEKVRNARIAEEEKATLEITVAHFARSLQALTDAWFLERGAGGDTEAVALKVAAELKQTFATWWPPWLASSDARAAVEAAVHLAVTIGSARVALEAEC
ncbi:hypothetical protein FGB62_62g243 [Gracilaria domingensis]|nr:hypothetical protein FGB62_62g243 [Gracilaria domingensis]